VGLYQLKPAFQRTLLPLARRLAEWHVSPDMLSAASVLISLVGAGLLLLGPTRAAALLAPLAVARLACNALDGMLARAAGRTDPRGYVVNEITDRVSDVLLLAALSAASGIDPRLGALVLVLSLLGSHLAVVSRAAGGQRPTSGPMGKSERMAVLALAGLAASATDGRWPLEAGVWAILAGLVVTIADRTRRIERGLRAA
jgi:CDP-diacylglycerol--glycerol-3-phosphate 3-phosphatidyltransferase